MLDVSAFQAFLTVVDTGTVHEAAARLGISQPALSRRLQRLEASIGVRLFARAHRRLHLSEAGAELLPHVRMHLDGLEHALAAVRDANTYGIASVTIGCLATLSVAILPPVLAEFASRHPQVQVRVLDLSAREIEASVRDGTADFALTMLRMDEPTLRQELVAEELMALLVPAAHPLSARDQVDWKELEGKLLIGVGPQSANRRLLEQAQSRIGVVLRWRHEVQRLSTAVELVLAGMGIAVLPMLSLASPREGLKAVALTNPQITRRLGILRRPDSPLSPTADALRRACIARLRSRLAGGRSEQP
jgi:DNA-binding transcriptional LysR family regulator